jgi:indole-3-glycerol phosphate synthase
VNERLESLVAATRQRLDERKRVRSLDELDHLASEAPPSLPFAESLSRPGTSVIAEYKRRSPSAGTIRAGASVEDMVGAYERGGAAALSVLTEEDHFGGSLADLEAARAVSDLPILRKDFTIDPYQVYEAKVAGADAVLLVVGTLSDSELGSLYGIAQQLELDAIVEVHDEEELECALELDVDVIGINNRNLEDFTVDIQTTVDLLAAIPTGKTVVSESGIRSRAEIEELERVGVDAVLIGETLMRAPDPEAAVRELTRPEEQE